MYRQTITNNKSNIDSMNQQLIAMLKQCFNNINFSLTITDLKKPNQTIVIKTLRMIVNELNYGEQQQQQQQHLQQVDTNDYGLNGVIDNGDKNFNEYLQLLQQLVNLLKEFIKDNDVIQQQNVTPVKLNVNLPNIDLYQLIFNPDSNGSSFRTILMALIQLKYNRKAKLLYIEQVRSRAIKLQEYRKKIDEQKQYLNDLRNQCEMMRKKKDDLIEELRNKQQLDKELFESTIEQRQLKFD